MIFMWIVIGIFSYIALMGMINMFNGTRIPRNNKENLKTLNIFYVLTHLKELRSELF